MFRLIEVIGKRILLGLVTLFIVSLIIFSSISLLPGDFAQCRAVAVRGEPRRECVGALDPVAHAVGPEFCMKRCVGACGES